MKVEGLPQTSRFMFWCTAPFLVATLVVVPLCARPPAASGWIAVGAVEVFCICVLCGLYNPARFWWVWRMVGAIIFMVCLAYLISMVMAGEWFGNGRRSAESALNALIALVAFGYPGLMYAVLGRFTWRAQTEQADDLDDLPE